MKTPMNWDQEVQDLIDDLLVEALTIELFRLAAAQHASALSRFPQEIGQELLARCGDHLVQRAADLQTWSLALASRRFPQDAPAHISRVRT